MSSSLKQNASLLIVVASINQPSTLKKITNSSSFIKFIKMKHFILIGVLFLAFTNCIAQFNNNWVLGGGNIYFTQNISFTTGVPLSSSLGVKTRFQSTSTCISDTNSNLLFYANGIVIYDAQGDTMQNGAGLSPSSWTNSIQNTGLNLLQAVVTIPIPGSATQYYLVHTTLDSSISIPVFPFYEYYGTKLYYSVIDMAANGGLGEVVQKNINILPSTDTIVGTSLTCCRHANGRDWWLITHAYSTNEYYTWLISPNGFQGPFKQSISPAAVDIPYGFVQCKFSPDGKKYAAVIDYTKNDSIHTMWLYNFNRCSGLLDSAVELNYTDIAVAVGCEFSPNSKVLYANTVQYLYQWDLQATNIQQSKLLIDSSLWYFDSLANFSDRCFFWLLQKAADDKIYISTKDGTSVLSCINNPDSIGLSCNFVQAQVQLNCFNFQSIPNQVYFGLGADSGSVCDTLTGSPPTPEGGAIAVYPNPAKDKLNIETDVLYGNATICIYNLLGEMCFTSETKNAANTISLNVSTLKQGLYLVQVKTAGKVWSKKFIKE